MRFEEAFDLAFDQMRIKYLQEGKKFVVTTQTAKILTFMWNILAFASQDGKIILDDFCSLDNNYNIISIPIEGKESGKKSPEKTAKKTSKIEADNGNSPESNEETA